MKYFIKILITLLICILMLPSQAAMVTTSELAEQQSRTRLVNLLQRKEVQVELIELGVDPAIVIVRVNHMTDKEVAALHGRIANLPVASGSHPAAYARVFWLFIFILLVLGAVL